MEDSKPTLLGRTLEVGRTPSLLLMCALYFQDMLSKFSPQHSVLSTQHSALRSLSTCPLLLCSVLSCSEGRSADRWQDYSLYGHQVHLYHGPHSSKVYFHTYEFMYEYAIFAPLLSSNRWLHPKGRIIPSIEEIPCIMGMIHHFLQIWRMPLTLHCSECMEIDLSYFQGC